MKNNRLYAVIDVETTGSGSGGMDRITEIAVVLHDGDQIVDRFESLVNPGKPIPPFISKLTGITNKMVAKAPPFGEVARHINEMTQDSIFVAHNVSFDYGVVQKEMEAVGLKFERKKICTVRLSRKAFPGHRSYSLESLIDRFDIAVKDRHRAMADTLATVEVLERILEKEEGKLVDDDLNHGIRKGTLPEGITVEALLELPETCGIYYLYDKNGDILYIGAAKNLRKKVLKHFAYQVDGITKLAKETRSFSHELTGTELVAKLYEQHELKRHNPRHNRSQTKRKGYCIHDYVNGAGYHCLAVSPLKSGISVQVLKKTDVDAVVEMQQLIKDFFLCTRFAISSPLYASQAPCQNVCIGACKGEEEPESYNKRVAEAVKKLQTPFERDFLILDKGRHEDEYSVVRIHRGKLAGIGFTDNTVRQSKRQLAESISPLEHLPTTEYTIRNYLRGNRWAKVLKM